MANCNDSLLHDEISVLQSIYLPEEFEVKEREESAPCEILATLHPYTADNEDEKYVYMQLVIKVYDNYPFSKPSFDIRKPRGISDNQLNSILANLDGLASHRLGEEMLFTLIEYAKECLTNNNRPECPCSICLDTFQEDDTFIRTECFHFFHGICMARYLKSYTESMEIKRRHPPFRENDEENVDLIPCPVCRTNVSKSSLKLDGVDTESYISEKVAFEPSEKFISWRKRMEVLFQRQKKRGGIIDIEAERNRFLIETKTPEDRVYSENTTDAKGNDRDERRYVTHTVSDWIADDQAFTDKKSEAVGKSGPRNKYLAYSGGQRKSFPRKNPGVKSGRGRKTDEKSSASKQYNPRVESFEGTKNNGNSHLSLDQERQMTSRIRNMNIKDNFVRETDYRKGNGYKTVEDSSSSKSHSKTVISPPPGFKPLT